MQGRIVSHLEDIQGKRTHGLIIPFSTASPALQRLRINNKEIMLRWAHLNALYRDMGSFSYRRL